MLTQIAMGSFRKHIIDTIAYAQFKVGNTYYKADIKSASVISGDRISITFLIDHTLSGNMTVTEVQLYDHNGALWASKPENILRKDRQEGVLYRFAFTISES